MKIENIKSEIIQPKLTQGEELVGFFYAIYFPNLSFTLITGMFGGMNSYYVAVTSLGIQIHELDFLNNKPQSYKFFTYSEISKLNIGKGFARIPLNFEFTDGTKLMMKAQLRGLASIPKLDEKTKEFLASKFVQ